MDADNFTVAELEAHVATIDDLDELTELRVSEVDGQNRKTALDVIDGAIERVGANDAEASPTFPTYEFDVDEVTTFVIGHPDGEVTFTTDEDGSFTPTRAVEEWAVKQLGGQPRKEHSDA